MHGARCYLNQQALAAISFQFIFLLTVEGPINPVGQILFHILEWHQT